MPPSVLCTQVKTLLEAVPNLAMLETVDSEKLASKLDSTGREGREGARQPIRHVQCRSP